MKLVLVEAGITIGGGPNYYLDADPKGLSGDLENVNIKIPRSDFSINVADWLNSKLRTFSGTIIGNDVDDFRTKKRTLVNILRVVETFQLIDDYKNADGTYTTFATYQFTGKIISIDPNMQLRGDSSPGIRSNASGFSITIASEDSLLYALPAVDETADIEPIGFTFPLTFPFEFVGSDNEIIFNNPGAIVSYPTIIITGPITNLKIINGSAPIDNKVFTFSGTLNALDELVLTPNPTISVKARKNGVSVINSTNQNWDALTVYPGENKFVFFGNGKVDGQTSAEIIYYPAFMGI